jgi:DNA-binding protein H-NS
MDHLLDRGEVCRYFGGTRPINPATLYRGIKLGRYPKAVKEKQLAALEPGKGNSRIGSSLRGKKVPPKYRSAKGETWAGRGVKPRWLVAAIKGGKKLDDFLIDKGQKKRSR